MRKGIRRILFGLHDQLLLIRLRFVKVEKPEGARSPEQMLEEIKKKSEFT
ncbi:MAG: hypothetical protein LUC98_13765 [Lachnospiraceae bacterium]|nr:hypothetical protein [Lachnospiraceae bacterium]